jgi:hypothetical protein
MSIDPYGNVLKSISVAYGRRLAARPADTPLEAWQAQQEPHLVLLESRFTDDEFTSGSGVYRLPVECESRSWELTGLVPPQDGLFTLAALAAAAPGQRLLTEKRVLFLADDLASPLALGKQSQLGLTHQSYLRAFTPDSFRQLIPASKVADDQIEPILSEEGKYVHFDDGHGAADLDWWIRSGTSDYLGPQTAPLRFFQPAAYVDPRGVATQVFYSARTPAGPIPPRTGS